MWVSDREAGSWALAVVLGNSLMVESLGLEVGRLVRTSMVHVGVRRSLSAELQDYAPCQFLPFL